MLRTHYAMTIWIFARNNMIDNENVMHELMR